MNSASVTIPVYKHGHLLFSYNGCCAYFPLVQKRLGHFTISYKNSENALRCVDRIIEVCKSVFNVKDYDLQKDPTANKYHVFLKGLTAADCEAVYKTISISTYYSRPAFFGEVKPEEQSSVEDPNQEPDIFTPIKWQKGDFILKLHQHESIMKAFQKAYFRQHPMTPEEIKSHSLVQAI